MAVEVSQKAIELVIDATHGGVEEEDRLLDYIAAIEERAARAEDVIEAARGVAGDEQPQDGCNCSDCALIRAVAAIDGRTP